MGFDRSGSACGNLARSDAQHGGYASRKTLHPRIGSANPHADRNPYSDPNRHLYIDSYNDTHGNFYSNQHPYTDSSADIHTNTYPNWDSYINIDSLAQADRNPNSNTYTRVTN